MLFRSDHVTLRAFPAYFDGAPKNSGLRFRVIPDDTMRGLELRKGSVDVVVNDLTPDLVHALRADPALADLLRGHQWHELFWQKREALAAGMGFFVFGHALYEKALQPFAGVTGRGLIFDCAADLLRAPAAQQNAEIDALVAGVLNDDGRLAETRELAAVPIFGIPGWCAENARESYYDDRSYFRPAPLKIGRAHV